MMLRYRARWRRSSNAWFGARQQYGYAVTCTVFSAFAVEHMVKRLITVRQYLHLDKATRDAYIKRWEDGPPGTKKLMAFLKKHTRVPHPLLKRIRKLLDYRNDLAHSLTKAELSQAMDPVHGELESTKITFHVLGSQDLKNATRALAIARRAVPALQAAITERATKQWTCPKCGGTDRTMTMEQRYMGPITMHFECPKCDVPMEWLPIAGREPSAGQDRASDGPTASKG